MSTKSCPKYQQKIACFRCNTTSLRPAIIYENFIFAQKYALVERCCFLTFSFEGNIRKYDISVKRKYTKTNENMIFSALFTNFRKKILFFMQCQKPMKQRVGGSIISADISFDTKLTCLTKKLVSKLQKTLRREQEPNFKT